MDFSVFLKSVGTSTHVRAGEHLFHEGDVCDLVYFIQRGLFKAYYSDADGREHVKSLLVQGDFIGSLSSAYKGEGCSYSLVCLEDADALAVPFQALYDKARKDQATANAVMDMLLIFAMKKERREYELLCLSAEDRYRRLLDSAPQFADHVTQETIARYLGITPVALSRIKKRIS